MTYIAKNEITGREGGKKDYIMSKNECMINWCLNWGEDKDRGFPSCYCVSIHQECERRKLRDGTSDVLYRLNLRHKTGMGFSLAFGIDYIPNHRRVTKWHDSVADCWREMLTLDVSEKTMKIIERDICGEDTYSDRAPKMLEYFRELCRAQAENPDEPKI